MELSSQKETFRIFNILINGRSIDRYAILEKLGKDDYQFDRGLLRTQIIYALSHDYIYKKTEIEDKDPKAMIRRFLLNALARISEDDKNARKFVRKYLDPSFEPNRWVRCDLLEGLVAVNATDLSKIALDIQSNDNHPWLQMRAKVLLARDGDQNALKDIQNALRENSTTSVLRALRMVPIEEVVDAVITLAKPSYNSQRGDTNYDAVVALGQIPHTWPQVEKAAEVLLENLEYCHDNWWLTSLWARTLEALGNLRVARTYPYIIEELTRDDPSIIFEAARALQKVLGLPTAVARIVEIASNADRIFIEGYASALRWMDRDLVIEKLEEMMVSGPVEQQETARNLLIEIGGLSAFEKVQARKVAVTHYMQQLEETENRIRDLFETSIYEAQNGYKLATFMDLAIFILGIVLIGVSAILALIQQGNLDQWSGVGLSTGGAGVLGILYGLIKDPRRRIPKEVDHLMHVKVVFLGYLRQLHQVDQAYTRRLIEDQNLLLEEVEDFSNLVGETMKSAVEEISRIDLVREKAEKEPS